MKNNSEPPFYNSLEMYQMENRRGRKPKYLTVERFEKFVSNDFLHLNNRVWYIIGALAVLIPLVIAILAVVSLN